jgi:hypothetical protein
MVKNQAVVASNIASALVAPSFFNYPTTTWSAKRAYAHVGSEAFGVNG